MQGQEMASRWYASSWKLPFGPATELYFCPMTADQSDLVELGWRINQNARLSPQPRRTDQLGPPEGGPSPCPPSRLGNPTLRGAAVQVPQIVQLVRQLHQFGPRAAVGSPLHLQPLSLQLGQSLVIGHLLHQTPHLGPEVQLHLVQGGVCVLHCVVEQGGLGTGVHSAA